MVLGGELVMDWAVPAVILIVAAAAAGLTYLRPYARRWRWRRRLIQAEGEVAAAMADGRLQRATGEAMLQHLEGLRRQCTRNGEG